MSYRPSLVLVGLLLAACATPAVQSSGYVAADGRLFVQAPKYPGQALGSGVSLIAEPQLDVKSKNGEHTATVRPFYRLDPNDEKRSHADVRQADYRLSLEHWQLGAGAGQFSWGVLESYRPTDILNQTDFVEAVEGGAKLGQPYAEIGYIGSSAALRVYYLPYFRERTFPGLRGRLRFPSVTATDNPLYETRLRRWQPSAAARFSFTGGDFDVGLSVFTGVSREPRFVAELTSGQVAPRYDLEHQASADAQWALGAFVLKAESFVRLWTSDLRAFAGGGGGVDYTFFKVVREADVSLAAEYLFDTRPAGAPVTFFEHDAFVGLRFAVNDTASTEFLAGAITDVVDGTTFVRLSASRRIDEHWKVVAGGNFFLGTSGKLESSFVKDNYLNLRLAHYF